MRNEFRLTIRRVFLLLPKRSSGKQGAEHPVSRRIISRANHCEAVEKSLAITFGF